MRNLQNIERIAGRYTGYCAGRIFRIVKGSRGWTAHEQGGNRATLYAPTLTALSERLEELDPSSDRAKRLRGQAIAARSILASA